MNPGARFGRYRIESALGSGGMGSVYVAHDERMHRRVALKVLHAADSRATERLLREARAAAAISHPNVVRVFDVGDEQGIAFLTMELLQGRTLRAELADAPPLATRVAWLAAIARALQAGHDRGIVHRDLKPENVLIAGDGAVKVLDFGIAQRAQGVIDAEADTALRATAPTGEQTGAAGTLLYMAPEHLRGDEIGAASDQWAWGIVAYEVLVGDLPWDTSRGALAVISQILERDPTPPSARSTALTVAVDGVVLRTLRKAQSERFASIAAASDALERAIFDAPTVESPVQAPAATVAEAPRRRWLVLAAIAALLVAILAVARIRAGAPAPAGVTDAAVDADVARALPPDFGSPMSTDVDALTQYREGIQAFRDSAAVGTVRRRMEAALLKDPEFAAARLRYLLTWENPESVGRTELDALLARRDRLGAHDRALVHAIEPWFRVPFEIEELRQRFAELAQDADPDFDVHQCMFFVKAGLLSEALAACRRAAQNDPQLALARLGEGLALERQGDAKGAEAAFHACLAISPEGARCIEALGRIAMTERRCADFAELAGRLVASAPDDYQAYRLRGDALYRDLLRGKGSIEAWDATVDGFIARIPARYQDEERDLMRGVRGFAVGELDSSLASYRRWEADITRRADEDQLAGTLEMEVDLLIELGRRRDAKALVDRWLAERVVWHPSAITDSRLRAYGYLYLLGAIPRSRFVAERSSWLESERRRGASTADDERWLAAYGAPVVSRADAQEALGAMPAASRDAAEVKVAYAAGVAYLAAGQPEQAIASLVSAGESCRAVSAPLAFVRSVAALGDAYAANGDSANACAAYARVVALWGRSPSRTAAHAREQARALRCGAP
jgi:serine/threonine-protein kinase